MIYQGSFCHVKVFANQLSWNGLVGGGKRVGVGGEVGGLGRNGGSESETTFVFRGSWYIKGYFAM